MNLDSKNNIVSNNNPYLFGKWKKFVGKGDHSLLFLHDTQKGIQYLFGFLSLSIFGC